MCGDRVNSVQHSKYHGYWCPGSLRRQDISTHDIDYVELVRFCLTWARISTTCVMSMWRNGIKHKYIFLFPLKNLACKGLMLWLQYFVVVRCWQILLQSHDYMWGKIMIPMYRLWFQGLYGLYGPRCLLSPKRPLKWITDTHSWLYGIMIVLIIYCS